MPYDKKKENYAIIMVKRGEDHSRYVEQYRNIPYKGICERSELNQTLILNGINRSKHINTFN